MIVLSELVFDIDLGLFCRRVYFKLVILSDHNRMLEQPRLLGEYLNLDSSVAKEWSNGPQLAANTLPSQKISSCQLTI